MKTNTKESFVFQHGVKDFDKKYYKRFFNRYDQRELELSRRWFEGWYRFIKKYIEPSEKKKVLELGCFIGSFSGILKDNGFDVIGGDISSFIIEKAKKLRKDIQFLTLNIEKDIKLKDNFDYIIAFEVVEHLNNPKRALTNIRKRLKKGGTFIFSTPFPSKQSLSDPTHINVHESTWWLRSGIKAGFRKRKHVYVSFIPYLYRFSGFFSLGFPIKLDLPYINSTSIFFFQK